MLNLFITTTKATPTYTTTHCTNTTTYAPNTTFPTNLNILFYYFSNNISQSNGYFLTITGFGTADAVSGLYLCRGDVTAAVCDQCLTAAVKEIRVRCPNQREALIWYDECFLRFTNRYFAVNKIVPRWTTKYDAIKKIGVFFLTYIIKLYTFSGDFARWTTNSRKETFKKFRTRHDRI
jgi:hypothetical protein